MSLRYKAAQCISACATWGLKTVFHRPAANFPGKLAYYADPYVISHSLKKLKHGSIAVVGTNGKTTVSNLLANVLEAQGWRVTCNRSGANLFWGVSTALLQSKEADWGVFESDEMWLARSLPQLQSNLVVLLNLFRDQLDRVGEIDRVQDSIVSALEASPSSVLIYNADDPLCSAIARRAAALPARKNTAAYAFGIKEDMRLGQNRVVDATMCPYCLSMFEYRFRQYGQLGDWYCPKCGFSRPSLDFEISEVRFGSSGFDFCLSTPTSTTLPGAATSNAAPRTINLRSPLPGSYMVYNLGAVASAAHLLGCSQENIQKAMNEFDPQNGRLQSYCIGGRKILLNLAKNPTGFNQNLRIIASDTRAKVVAFFINDKEADGHDVSWLWDIDFEELAQSGKLCVFAGGIRAHDMQVRLKYANIFSRTVESAEELLSFLKTVPTEIPAYFIANYTALPAVKSALDVAKAAVIPPALSLSKQPDVLFFTEGSCSSYFSVPQEKQAFLCTQKPLVIAHMFPDLLNLYGDGGNVTILERRLQWRGIPVEVTRVFHGQSLDFNAVDLVVMGGSPDAEQRLASQDLSLLRETLNSYIENDGPLLAICGSYQMLGQEWLLNGEEVAGLGVLDIHTRRPGTSADRLTNNIVLKSPLSVRPVVGFENHAGRTYLKDGIDSFGKVLVGVGNSEQSKTDGVIYRGVIGTYLHGPLLSKNPEIADFLLQQALARYSKRTGTETIVLEELNNSEEIKASAAMCTRLHINDF